MESVHRPTTAVPYMVTMQINTLNHRCEISTVFTFAGASEIVQGKKSLQK